MSTATHGAFLQLIIFITEHMKILMLLSLTICRNNNIFLGLGFYRCKQLGRRPLCLSLKLWQIYNRHYIKIFFKFMEALVNQNVCW